MFVRTATIRARSKLPPRASVSCEPSLRIRGLCQTALDTHSRAPAKVAGGRGLARSPAYKINGLG